MSSKASDAEVAAAMLLCGQPGTSASNPQKHYSATATPSLSSASASTSTPPNVPLNASQRAGDTFAVTARKNANSTTSDKKRGKSAEDDSLAEEGEEQNEDGSKPLKNTSAPLFRSILDAQTDLSDRAERAAQNRAAQRAFRERKEQYVGNLEKKSQLLDETLKDMEAKTTLLDAALSRERSLEAQVAQLQHLLDSRHSDPAEMQQHLDSRQSHANAPRPPSFSGPSSSRPSSSSYPSQSLHGDRTQLSPSAWEQREADIYSQRKTWEMERHNYQEEQRMSEGVHRALASEREEHSRGMREREGLRGMLEESRRENAIIRTELATALQASSNRS